MIEVNFPTFFTKRVSQDIKISRYQDIGTIILNLL